ncbi:MAG: AraC family transcriptional regulator, partial [Bacillota bacterium]|nr:AraC family transcriptional regulator [Bacillota bacterium]
EEYDVDYDEDDFIEVECPSCQDIVYFESSIADDEDIIEVTCPNCEETVFINDGSYELEDIPEDRMYYNRQRQTEDI